MHVTDTGFLALFDDQVAKSPDRLFAAFADGDYSFGDIDLMSSRLAGWLFTIGIKPGDHVALMVANSPVALALLFAIAKARAVWVPVNTRAKGDSLAYILSHCEPALIIADDDLIEIIAACSPGLDVVAASAAEARAQSGNGQPGAVLAGAGLDADTPYAIMYTSGTTGRPKGVIVSHRMLRYSGEAIAIAAAPRPGDIMYMWEPLFHIGGAQMIVLPLIHDVSLSFASRFSATGFWREVNERGASHIHFLGGILQLLLKQPPGPLDQAHGARMAWGGGCPREVWRPFEERFGVEIRECYGMTECSSVTSLNRTGTLGSVGRPVPWFDVEIVRPDGAPAKPGETGEIIVSATQPGALTKGYLNNRQATAEALAGGRFRTGDLGSLDADGNLFFHGRMSDSVRVRGENVSAFEVEHVAVRHPAVEDCAMIGVAAEIGEQDIKLFVKPKAGMELDVAAFSAWLAEGLAVYQRPRYIKVVDEFERTPSQRIMKHRLSKTTEDAWDTNAAERPQDG